MEARAGGGGGRVGGVEGRLDGGHGLGGGVQRGGRRVAPVEGRGRWAQPVGARGAVEGAVQGVRRGEVVRVVRVGGGRGEGALQGRGLVRVVVARRGRDVRGVGREGGALDLGGRLGDLGG